MNLSSLTFIGIYFPILIVLLNNPWFKGNGMRKIILFLASIGLYTFSEPTYALLLVGIIICNYLMVKMSIRAQNDLFRAVAVGLDVFILLFFKYINQFLPLRIENKEIVSIAFPLGLSYFIFKTISFVVDSKRQKNGTLLDVAIYISNFMTIISGPLSTYQDELPMIKEKTEISSAKQLTGIERIITGFAKKTIIADSLSFLVLQAFDSPNPSFIMAWAGAIAFTLQLFFDFSGYTDMALGVGILFGFDFPENFDYPYMAKSISDFWKRWHISLTKWFTKYIYIPLGGSRVATAKRHIFNLFVVWVVTGIWHGSNVTFIVWAMIYFVLQTVEKYFGLPAKLEKYHIGNVYTLFIVVIEWVIFRSESITHAIRYIKCMFLLNGNGFISTYDGESILRYFLPLTLGIVFSTDIGKRIDCITKNNKDFGLIKKSVLLVLYCLCIIITISQGYTAPLYAGF